MIGIIGAMDLEIEQLLAGSTVRKVETYADKQFFLACFHGRDLVIAKSGVGKVNAAITTTLLLTIYKPEYVLNIGVAGGLAGTKIKDIVIASGVAYSDVSLVDIDAVPYGKMGDDPLIVYPDSDLVNKAMRVLNHASRPYRKGNIVSGDSFVTKKAALAPILAVIPDVVACEMEGMAIAMTCHKFNVPFLSVRGISDLVEADDQGDAYRLQIHEVAAATAGFVLEFLEEQDD